MSPEYISKYIQIMDDHIKLPLCASLCSSGPFTFFIDQTPDLTMTEQMAIYATFYYQGTIKKHVGTIPISKLVGTELSAPNIMKALIKFFDEIDVPITQARFSCMDNTNVNSGSRGGLKRYILHEIPIALWVGCGNYKLALCFKHLLKEFPYVAEFDIALLLLWKYFHYRPLAVNFLQEFGKAYNENQALPVCPSTTRCTSHGRACKTLYEGYQAQYVITRERSLKHWVYSWPSHQKSSLHHYAM